MVDAISKILDLLLKYIDPETVKKVIRLFRPVILVLIPCALALSGFLFYQMVTRIRNGDRIMTNTIVAKYESTAEPYKALEALVLNGLDTDSKPLKTIPVSNDTIRALNSLSTLDAAPTNAVAPKVINFTLKHKESTGRPYLIAEGSRIFILATTKSLPENVDDLQTAQDAFARDTKLKATLDSLAALDNKLCFFNGKPLASDLPPVIQTYVISEKNVIALCGTQEGAGPEEVQNTDYEKDYPADRDFIGTQYWKDTMKTEIPSATGSSDVEGYFHVTSSYIDTAGNGIVRSYCRDIVLPPSTKRNAMICFDTPTPATLQKITDKMLAFSGGVFMVKCDSQGCNAVTPGAYDILASVSRQIAEWLFPVQAHLHVVSDSELKRRFEDAQNTHVLENASGHLNVFPNTEDSVTFSIPFGAGPKKSSFFLLSEIRFGVFQQSSFRNGLWAGGCLIFALLLLVGVFVETAIRLDQQKQVRERINDLMNEVPIAFCSGSEEDAIQFLNPAFADLLGYRNVNAALDALRGEAFEKLLFSNEDLKAYKKIRRQREHGRFSQAYEVTLTKENQNEGELVRVFSTSLPNVASRSNKGFETFGLFFPTAKQ